MRSGRPRPSASEGQASNPCLRPGSDHNVTHQSGLVSDPLPPGTGVRDKVWQRLVVEEVGVLPQPGFAAVSGDRVEMAGRPTAADLADVLSACPGSYILKPVSDSVTEVTYQLTVDVKIPMLGMIKRKAEKVIIDRALAGLKKRVESGA